MRIVKVFGLTAGLAMASALVVSGITGCAGEAKMEVKTPEPPPPPPPPPPPDTDGDGIADNEDKCVDKKEDGLDPDAKDGCPNEDPDKDGIKAEADKCPDKAEVVNGFEDEDGCPDEKPKVQVTDKEIKINDKILFETGSAKIDKASDDLIEAIAKVIKEHPEIEFIEIAGHADKRGNDIANKQLTQKRAEAVQKVLIGDGVDKSRLRSVGFGSYCPLDPGDSEDALEKNRRVEFIILRKGGQPLEAKWGGCEAAEKKGMKAQPLPAVTVAKADKPAADKAAPPADKPAADKPAADKAAPAADKVPAPKK